MRPVLLGQAESVAIFQKFRVGKFLIGSSERDKQPLGYHETALCGQFCSTRQAESIFTSQKLNPCASDHLVVLQALPGSL